MKENGWLVMSGAVVVGMVVWLSIGQRGPDRTMSATGLQRGPDLLIQAPRPGPVNQAEVRQQLTTLQIPFIANQGQTDQKVRFYAPTFGGTVFITRAGEIVYALPGHTQSTSRRVEDKSQARFRHVRPRQGTSGVDNTPLNSGVVLTGVVLTEELVGGKVQAVQGEGLVPTKVNVFRGNDPAKWQHNLPTYKGVSLGEVYEGVEIKLKAYGNTVEKLFYVRAGAKPEQIRVKVRGGKLRVNEQGELETELGGARFSKPVAYQEAEGQKRLVEVTYVVSGEEYGFRVGSYDRSQALVIDPILAATFLGGSGIDEAHALALDDVGNVYVAGVTAAGFPGDFPGVGPGSADDMPDATSDEAFVVKLNGGLTGILAATFLGGSGATDRANALTLDSAGNVYVAGKTAADDFPGVGPGSADSTIVGGEAFVAKLNADLSVILAATFLGGSGGTVFPGEEALALALDNAGNLYVAGVTDSANFPGITAAASADSTFAGDSEGFVARLNASLSVITAVTFLGGSGDFDRISALALDNTGNVHVAGSTDSANFPGITGAASADSAFVGDSEAFVARLNAGLSVITAATFLGGSGSEGARALVLDSTGNVYVAGNTSSVDFPGVGPSSTSGAFVAKLDAGLSSILAATSFGGGQTRANALALDSTGKVYVAGGTNNANFPGVSAGESADSTFVGDKEAFVAKLDANLVFILAATFLGGSGTTDDFFTGESALALALDSVDNVYVAGVTDSGDFPVGGADTAFAGDREAFVALLDPNLSSPTRFDLGKLKDLVDSCDFCPLELQDSLLAKINLAIKQVRKGNNRTAANALGQFIKRTKGFVETKEIPAEEGQRFIELAEEIIAELSGRIAKR